MVTAVCVIERGSVNMSSARCPAIDPAAFPANPYERTLTEDKYSSILKMFMDPADMSLLLLVSLHYILGWVYTLRLRTPWIAAVLRQMQMERIETMCCA